MQSVAAIVIDREQSPKANELLATENNLSHLSLTGAFYHLYYGVVLKGRLVVTVSLREWTRRAVPPGQLPQLTQTLTPITSLSLHYIFPSIINHSKIRSLLKIIGNFLNTPRLNDRIVSPHFLKPKNRIWIN